jgi:hypothetical protein
MLYYMTNCLVVVLPRLLATSVSIRRRPSVRTVTPHP